MTAEQIALKIARRIHNGEKAMDVVREMIADGTLNGPEDSFEVKDIVHCALWIAEHFFI